MKKALLRLSSLLLTALGFGMVSCEIQSQVEYGSPTTDFSFKGKVTDAANKPLQGIRVIVQDSILDTGLLYYLRDTTYTGSDGRYALNPDWYMLMQNTLRFKVESPEGDYRGRIVDLPILPSDYHSTGTWTSQVEKTLDITLEPVIPAQ